MANNVQKEIIEKMIKDNVDISEDERYAFCCELETVSGLNGEQGLIGQAIKQNTYSSIIFRLGQKGRIENIIKEHTLNCPYKDKQNAFGMIKTKWGEVSGIGVVIFIVVAGIVTTMIGPKIVNSIWGNEKDKVVNVGK